MRALLAHMAENTSAVRDAAILCEHVLTQASGNLKVLKDPEHLDSELSIAVANAVMQMRGGAVVHLSDEQVQALGPITWQVPQAEAGAHAGGPAQP